MDWKINPVIELRADRKKKQGVWETVGWEDVRDVGSPLPEGSDRAQARGARGRDGRDWWAWAEGEQGRDNRDRRPRAGVEMWPSDDETPAIDDDTKAANMSQRWPKSESNRTQQEAMMIDQWWEWERWESGSQGDESPHSREWR